MARTRYSDALRDLVLGAPMSMKEVAEAVGVIPPTLSAWTTGRITLNPQKRSHREAVEAICKLLGASPSVVWGDGSRAQETRATYTIPPGLAIAEMMLRLLMDCDANAQDRELAYQTILSWLRPLF